MCLSKLYVEQGKERKLLMEEVSSLTMKGGKVTLKTLFGERKEIAAGIKEVDFLNHTILLADLKD
ncbi:MAG: CooT family nickel-binding protein [Dehalococcoidales bacterium]|nr:CooT family nickel-binding protein [Dehalococcoidales bacterium]